MIEDDYQTILFHFFYLPLYSQQGIITRKNTVGNRMMNNRLRCFPSRSKCPLRGAELLPQNIKLPVFPPSYLEFSLNRVVLILNDQFSIAGFNSDT